MTGGWKKVTLSDARECLFWMETSPDQCCCYLTDLENIYSETLDLQQFKRRFDKLNPDLEIDDVEDLLKDVVNVIAIEKNISSSVNGDNDIDLKCNWTEDGIEYKFMFSLQKGSSQLFKKNVTSKLINCVTRLSQEKDILLASVRNKDLEIEDFEMGGAQLSRKSLKSGWFKAEDAFKRCSRSPVDPTDFLSGIKFAQILNDSTKPVDEKDDNDQQNGVDINSDSGTNKVKDEPVIKRKFEKPNLPKNARASATKKPRLSKF